MRKPTKAEVKTVTVTIAGWCVRGVVATAIANVVPTETKTQKAQLFVGTYVIAGMVRKHAKEYASVEFDEWCEIFNTVKNLNKATPTEEETLETTE